MSTGTGSIDRVSLLAGLAWISPWLAGVLAFFAAPVAISIYYSFTDYSIIEAPVSVGLDNYREMLTDGLVHTAARNTLLFAAMNAGGSTVLALALALLLNKPFAGRGAVRAIIFVPTLVPAVSAAVTWLWLLNPKFGLFNGVLSAIGVSGPDWLGDRAFALPSLAIMSCWVIGSPLLVSAAALRDVPRSLYEAADIDGVSAWGRFRNVTLPMISPAILFNVVMSMIWSLQLFAPPLIMTRGGPENSTYSFSMYVYSNAFVYGRMGYACALGWVQAFVTLALAAIVLVAARRFVYYRAA